MIEKKNDGKTLYIESVPMQWALKHMSGDCQFETWITLQGRSVHVRKRPVPVMHFHGSKDTIVPFEVAKDKLPPFMKLKGAEDSIQTWVKLNGCDEKPKSDTLSKDGEEMKVTRTTYGGGKDEAEVVLVVIEERGHTWPGQKPPVGFIGKSAKNISANDLMWEFFQRHTRR